MDLQAIWTVIQDIQKHTSTMNSELATVQADIVWLKQSWWELLTWMRMLSVGIFISVVGTVFNIIISHKNGKK